MGANCCCSKDQTSLTTLLSANHHPQRNQYHLYGVQKIEPYEHMATKEWREILKNILLEIGNRKTWAPFKDAFFQLLTSSQSILKPTSLTAISSFSSRATEDNKVSQRSHASADSPQINLEEPAVGYNIAQPPQESNKNQNNPDLVPNITRRRSGKEKVRAKLIILLNQDNGIVLRLVCEFHQMFRKKFAKYLGEIGRQKYSGKFDMLYRRILHLIKEFFLHVIKNFIKKIYEPFMKKAEVLLKEEGYEPEYILESVAYELLFSNPNTTFNKLVLALLAKKYSERAQKFKNVLETRKNQILADDPILSEKFHGFLLIGNDMPYQEICDDYADIQNQTNPYTKFEIISTLWNKILKIAREYHKNNPDIERELGRKFDEDIRFQIMIYCIVKTQNQDLVVDEILIKDFVGENYKNMNKKFSWFRGYILYLMEEEDLIE